MCEGEMRVNQDCRKNTWREQNNLVPMKTRNNMIVFNISRLVLSTTNSHQMTALA